jgi:general secretion pathway protein M
MTAGFGTLPEGRAGQALAVAITLLAMAVLWLSAVSPVIGWYGSRAAALAAERQEIAHATLLRASLPGLRIASAAAARLADASGILLTGGSDAIAAANLQSALQTLAAENNASFDSIATVPPLAGPSLRRIGVQVSVTATWPLLIALLAAIETAHPRMIVDQLTVTSPGQTDGGPDAPLQAGFTVSAFRAGAP